MIHQTNFTSKPGASQFFLQKRVVAFTRFKETCMFMRQIRPVTQRARLFLKTASSLPGKRMTASFEPVPYYPQFSSFFQLSLRSRWRKLKFSFCLPIVAANDYNYSLFAGEPF